MEAIYSNIADFILHFDRYLPVVIGFTHFCSLLFFVKQGLW